MFFYPLKISCSKQGPKTFRISYNGEEIPVDVVVNILAGPFQSAKVELPLQVQSIDLPFSFKITAYDAYDNIAQL